MARIVYRTHAVERMFQRGISSADVRDVLERGEVIEEYPEDTPYPSRLFLAVVGERPLHVVAEDNMSDNELIVITVYQPDQLQWDQEYRRRRK